MFIFAYEFGFSTKLLKWVYISFTIYKYFLKTTYNLCAE